MSSNKFNRRATTANFLIGILASVLLLAFAGVALGQAPSTDRDNPTPFSSNVVTGDGVDEKTEYFYAFNAGPGEVTLTLDVKAEKDTAVSSVDIALFDAKSRKLLSTYANPDHGSSKRAVETVKVRGTQILLLEVTVSQGVDSFKIKVDGAVKFDPGVGGTVSPVDPSATPLPSATPSPTDSPAASDTSATTSPETAAADSSPSATADAQDAATTQASGAPAGATNKAGKVNARINSATSALSGIITSAGATADSVKSVKKKKTQ